MSPRRIAVFQHHPAEGPGRIATWASARAVELEIVLPEHAECPGPEASLDALILLGGPCGANDGAPWLDRERAVVDRWLASGKPVLGICLGAQIVARALGATVQPMPRAEHGWTDVRFGDGRSQAFLQWHDDAFTLPPGARLLATSADCACQMFDHGPHRIGLQFHPEWDAELVTKLHAAFGTGCPLPLADEPALQADAERWLAALLDRWFATGTAGARPAADIAKPN